MGGYCLIMEEGIISDKALEAVMTWKFCWSDMSAECHGVGAEYILLWHVMKNDPVDMMTLGWHQEEAIRVS